MLLKLGAVVKGLTDLQPLTQWLYEISCKCLFVQVPARFHGQALHSRSTQLSFLNQNSRFAVSKIESGTFQVGPKYNLTFS